MLNVLTPVKCIMIVLQGIKALQESTISLFPKFPKRAPYWDFLTNSGNPLCTKVLVDIASFVCGPSAFFFILTMLTICKWPHLHQSVQTRICLFLRRFTLQAASDRLLEEGNTVQLSRDASSLLCQLVKWGREAYGVTYELNLYQTWVSYWNGN